MSEGLPEALRRALAAGEPAALVTLTEARGSTPRDAGVAILVTAVDVAGTIGGGTYEWEAIAAARRLLDEGGLEAHLRMALGPQIGQCCGGRVTLRIQRANTALLEDLKAEAVRRDAESPHVVIYGAGHIGRALALALDPLPFRTRIVDARADEIAQVTARQVERILGSPGAAAEAAPDSAAHIVVTHSHALDGLICASLLENGCFAYLGLIGSATKRATFVHAFRDIGIADAAIARLVCPIGGTAVRDKRPTIIAALVAAELIAVFA